MSHLDKFKIALNKVKKAKRAPFKEDFETESEPQPQPVVEASAGDKKAMPRHELKKKILEIS